MEILKIKIPKKIIQELLESKEYKIIRACLITGGEPFTNKEGLTFFLEYLLNKKITIWQLDMVTNALIFDKAIMDLLQELNKNTYITVETRIDQFHPQVPKENLEKFYEYPFYYYCEENLTAEKILPLGKAYENSLGTKKSYEKAIQHFNQTVQEHLEVSLLQSNEIEIDSLYVTANGNFGSYTPEATWKMKNFI